MEKSLQDKITELSDYPMLKKLSAALWREDAAYHGAAVMIGAGFSRSAATSGDISKKLPLWMDLSKALAKDLNASNYSDPLRLAEEYYASFGKQALHDLIKREVDDSAWVPGDLYTTLLELPWSEVLTTNWDTLLERATLDVHEPVYGVVSKQEDFASVDSPRIVKLHGTINVTPDLIFTQEDYRKYPQANAAFVNFARQVFIENELCLLGFSGDDPNFLQWAGWVRDNLATHARRIYLVGALNLTSSKRKYLESINVAPIDLGSLVLDYDDHDTKHSKVTEIFLQTLLELKPKQPWNWSPSTLQRSNSTVAEYDKQHKDNGYAATLLEQQIPILVSDRKSYPGWLVCPTQLRWYLQNQISSPYPTPENLAQLSAESRAKLLYEIVWRDQVTYEVTPLWLMNELADICDPITPCALSKKQQMEIALHLLKNSRWFDKDEVESIVKISTEILSAQAQYWPESTNELLLHQATIARDELDFTTLEEITNNISDTAPVWKLRKAYFLGELARFDEGEVLIAAAYQELLVQHRNDKNSIYILSRLAWAHWLLAGTDSGRSDKLFPSFSSLDEIQCNPWKHVQHIRDQVVKKLEKQQKHQEIEPLFEPGHYKDNSKSVTLSNELHPLLIFDGICSETGLPIRWEMTNYLADSGSALAEFGDVGYSRFPLAIRSANSDTSDAIKKVFSRLQIARTNQDEISRLTESCIKVIDYWSDKRSTGTQKQQRYALDNLRIFIEVLARLVVRAPTEQAKAIFRQAIKLGGNSALQHFWLNGSLNHLIQYSLKSIPEPQQHELLLNALSFPLNLVDNCGRLEWPNPVINHPGEREINQALDRKIDEAIDQVTPCSRKSSAALLRLLPLVQHDFLTTFEMNKLASAIWGEKPDYQILPETGLLKYVLLKLPSKDYDATKKLVRSSLFEIQDDKLFDSSILLDISQAAKMGENKQLPDNEQAIDYFNRLTAWRPKDVDGDLIQFRKQEEQQKSELVGEALAHSIVSSLPKGMLTVENFEHLHKFYSETNSVEVIPAFVIFAQASIGLPLKIEKILRDGLQSKNGREVSYSVTALLKWRESGDTKETKKLISRIIYFIEAGRLIGLPSLLWVANQMHSKGWLSDDEIDVLVDCVPKIFDDADYHRFNYADREAISISVVRTECVVLAKTLLQDVPNDSLHQMLDKAKNDALPEVRFAALT